MNENTIKVVRCKDCKHLTPDGFCFKAMSGITPLKPSADHFCAYGERKEKKEITPEDQNFKPECCQNCALDGTSGCPDERCKKWKDWFRKEWTNIRIAAEALKIVSRDKHVREAIRITRTDKKERET